MINVYIWIGTEVSLPPSHSSRTRIWRLTSEEARSLLVLYEIPYLSPQEIQAPCFLDVPRVATPCFPLLVCEPTNSRALKSNYKGSGQNWGEDKSLQQDHDGQTPLFCSLRYPPI